MFVPETMSVQSKYLTVKTRGEGLYKEKGSKFIGIAIRCYNEEEAKSYLEKWRSEHHQARHLCYAYRFGVDMSKYRANDDGEPSNSAGAPILGQIQSFELTNVLVGVVRYYGGTKLGVGGLINAYRTAAKNAIENSSIVELEVFDHYTLQFDYSDMPEIMNRIKKYELEVERKEFTEDCMIDLSFPLDRSTELKKEFNEFDTVQLTHKGIY